MYVQKQQKKLETNYVTVDQLESLQNEVQLCKKKQQQDNLSGRWLWTGGQLLHGGYIAWDQEVSNQVPNIFQWKKHTSSINIRLPGVYR